MSVCVSSDSMNHPDWKSDWWAGPLAREDVPHHAEGDHVEDRADRPDEDHEPADVVGAPLPRHGQILRVHVVPRDGRLRQIVEQIHREELDRQHRQERQERARDEHAEHVPEVRARRHLDVLDGVAERLPPLEHALLQHHQALLEQDDVGGFLGDVHRGIHRDAHVGLAQRAGVVDAIAHEAHGVAARAQRAHDAHLVVGRQLREHRAFVDATSPSCFVVESRRSRCRARCVRLRGPHPGRPCARRGRCRR